jgi:AcrR family transcriptional regulator
VPRSYSMGRRTQAVTATRQRILDAALALYQEQGIAAATMQDVARRADVAPGTVANHFGTAAALAAEAGQRLLSDLHLPPPEVFDGVDTLDGRVRILTRELAAFFKRSDPWFSVWQREPGSIEAWAEVEQRYYREFEVLMRAAVGTLAADADNVLVAASLITPPVLGALEAAGRSSDEAADLLSTVLLAWLASRDEA